MSADVRPGDVVRFRWGRRSGRWIVLRIDHPSWDGAVRVRCIKAPRGRGHIWRAGQEGWVKALMEVVQARSTEPKP